MHLTESLAWKERHLLDAERLEEGRHGEEVYLGRLLSSDTPSAEELQREEELLRQALDRFCPQIDQERLPLFLFPQIFLT